MTTPGLPPCPKVGQKCAFMPDNGFGDVYGKVTKIVTVGMSWKVEIEVTYGTKATAKEYPVGSKHIFEASNWINIKGE